jgi:hypothetical protein
LLSNSKTERTHGSQNILMFKAISILEGVTAAVTAMAGAINLKSTEKG